MLYNNSCMRGRGLVSKETSTLHTNLGSVLIRSARCLISFESLFSFIPHHPREAYMPREGEGASGKTRIQKHLFPQIAEDVEVRITKIDISNFLIGVVSLKFFVLILILFDIGWLPGTLWHNCLFKVAQLTQSWILYLCWSIETSQSNAHHPMATLAWSAGRKSTMLTLVMILRTISILFNWTGARNDRQAEELPL